jgi:serine/threonine-protein kinase
MKQCDNCSRKFPDHMVFCPFDGDILDAEVEDPLLGRVIDGKYRLEEKLGEGGMGTVYRAKHVLIQNDLAIKVLHSSLVADRHAVARFQREATAAARIKHPNAVGVTDFGRTEDEIVYIVMELFIGQSLRDLIEQQGSLPVERSVTIIRQVCLALDAAHRSGVIHRDVKPDNIVIESNGQGELVKVLDFGIAKLKDGPKGEPGGRLTRQGVIIGSPHYLSPEQCQNSELDARSDIYSLGIVLYEMLTGDVPFKAPTPIAVAMMHTTEKPESVKEKRPDLPESIERVVMSALEKNPDNRPPSAIEMAQELERACLEAGLAVMPLPGSTAPYTLSPENQLDYQTRQMEAARVAASKSSTNVPVITPDTAGNNGAASVAKNASSALKFPTTSSLTPEKSARNSGLLAGEEAPSFISNSPSSYPPPSAPTPISLGNTSPSTMLTLGQLDKPAANNSRIFLAAIGAVIIVVATIGYFVLFSAKPTVVDKPKPIDPAENSPLGMVYVKGDTFKMGFNQSDKETDKDKFLGPEHSVTVASFYIDKTEVSNQEYKKFIDATKHSAPEDWKDGQFPPGTDLLPVTKVSWADADAYAKWLGKRLPTEAEWEFAARGSDGRAYPWGQEWLEGVAVSKEMSGNGAHTVGSLPKGASPFGVLDMAGNVWEWTADNFAPYPGNKDSFDPKLKSLKIIRGGSFKTEKRFLTAYFRNRVEASFSDATLGFRCVKSAS